MKGARGCFCEGLCTTERTVNAASARPVASAAARASSSTTTVCFFRAPCWSKSPDPATRVPSTEVSLASNGPGAKTPVMSQ